MNKKTQLREDQKHLTIKIDRGFHKQIQELLVNDMEYRTTTNFIISKMNDYLKKNKTV